jgi:methyl-accepting chemotaxis protein
VASEVRSLAQRSAQAAKDIKDLITNSTSQVEEGVDLVNRAGSSLNEIATSIKMVVAFVADIASASAQQATGLDRISKALVEMDDVTQQNSALVEENAATAQMLADQAGAMNERVAFFQLAEGSRGSELAHPAAVAGKPPAAAAKARAAPALRPIAARM